MATTKNTRTIFAATILGMALCALLAVTIGACKIPSADSISAIPAGTIKVNFGASASSSARTAVPDFAASTAVYVITCNNAATGATTTADVAGATSYQFTNIVPGSVTITVSAYSNATTKDSTTLIASGSSALTLAEGEGANVTVTLAMASSGTGGVDLEIQWPTSLADSVTWTLDGTAETAPAISYITDTSDARLTASAAAGARVMTITFKRGAATVGTIIETVNVYANLTSSKWVDASGSLANVRKFTASDLATTETGVSITVLVVGYNYCVMTKFSDSTSDSICIPAGASIIAIPAVETTGQKVQYNWEGAGWQDTSSGAVLSLNSSGTTALLLKTTATDGSSSQTYTLNVKSATAINTPDGLEAMALNGDYVLIADINMAGTSWTPKGTEGSRFTGSFDGGGHTISNLTAATANGDAGLFGCVDNGAIISNVRLKNVNVDGGSSGDGVGGLVGENYGGIIRRCSVSGTVGGFDKVGGLVGNNRADSTTPTYRGVISECCSTAAISASQRPGGLVGWNWGTISNSYARGNISSGAGGGFVDSNLMDGNSIPGIITNCYASVSGSLNGGFARDNTYGTGSSNFYDATVSGKSDTACATRETAASMQSSATYSGWDFNSIWAIDSGKNGGYPYLKSLPVADQIVISSSTSAAELRNLLINNLDGDFILTGPVNLGGTAWTPIGSATTPFSGTFDGQGNTITGLTISASSGSQAMFAKTGPSACIRNLGLKDVSISSNSGECISAIAAVNFGKLYRCWASGTVTGQFRVGGLVGKNGDSGVNERNAIIEECYSIVNVVTTTTINDSGSSLWNIGSLVAANYGKVKNCYSRGTVAGYQLRAIGSFMGRNESGGIVSNSYATGEVSYTASYDGPGGFCGSNDGGTISNCFYDKDTTLMNAPIDATQKTTTEMKTLSTFSAWSPVSVQNTAYVWGIDATKAINDGYPYLQYFRSLNGGTGTIATP